MIKPLSIDDTLTSSGSSQTDLLLDGFGNINDRVRHLIFDWILKNIFQLNFAWVNSIIGFFSWISKKSPQSANEINLFSIINFSTFD
jgi:hypothetical protein